MELKQIRSAVRKSAIIWQNHALERLFKRGISREEVKQTILNGEIIECYPDDYPLPSVLMFHKAEKPLHVVLAYNETNHTVYIITVYVPDLAHFEEDFKTRKIL